MSICSIQRSGFDLDAQQTSSLSSTSATSAISTSTGAASTISSSQSTSSVATSLISSSTATNPSSSSSSTSPTSQASANINPNPITLIPTASVVASTITSTQSLSATASGTATPQAQSASLKTKSTTLTVLIAVAASVGGIAILWTIFRKWKLSSSKEFDQRLNPNFWQPTNAEDDNIPTLQRRSSSFRSGGGSGDGDHDFTAGPRNTAPIGGYADLARASSTNPPMQQALERGPSFNHGYGVPIHHGYGHDDGGSARY